MRSITIYSFVWIYHTVLSSNALCAWEDDICLQTSVRKPQGRDYFGGLGIYGRVLKWIFKTINSVGRCGTEIIWLSMKSSGGISCTMELVILKLSASTYLHIISVQSMHYHIFYLIYTWWWEKRYYSINRNDKISFKSSHCSVRNQANVALLYK